MSTAPSIPPTTPKRATFIRMPHEMYEQIRATAAKEDRSINRQMVRYLREGMKQLS